MTLLAFGARLPCAPRDVEAAPLTATQDARSTHSPPPTTTSTTRCDEQKVSRHCQSSLWGTTGTDEGASWNRLPNSEQLSSWSPQAGKTPTDLVKLWQADTRNALEHPESGSEQDGSEGAAESGQDTPPVCASPVNA